MHFRFGPMAVTVMKTYTHGKSVYFQRHVPPDLRGRYPTKIIKRKLGSVTMTPAAIARRVAELDRAYTAEFEGLRAAPDATPTATKAHAIELLRRWGLQPAPALNQLAAVDLIHDHFDSKRGAWAGGSDEAYRDATPPDYLSPVELAAWQALHGSRTDTIGDVFEVYVGASVKDSKQFTQAAERAKERMIGCLGDKPVGDVSREDARRFVAHLLDTGIKTTSARRYLRTCCAAWNVYIAERGHKLTNHFTKLKIKQEGMDAELRGVYSTDDLQAIRKACRDADDDIRWLVALQIETGLRISEVAGCELADFKLDAETPHIELNRHPWRDTKTQMARTVSLVGVSLWAAKRIVGTATEGQRFAFPRYTSPNAKGEIECRGTHASNTACKWLRSLGFAAGTHAFRHTIKDRLREVGCPKDLHDRVTGHAGQGVGEDYGRSQLLRLQQEWLMKIQPEAMAPPPRKGNT
jgi:integrase